MAITIRADQPQQEVPGHFLGLSVEKEQLTRGEFVPANAVLSRLLQNLGAGTLRVGGNSVDYAPYGPMQSQLPSDCRIKKKWAFTPAMIEEMFRFAKGANWQVIYGLNLGCFAPAAAVAEAKYAYSVSQGNLLALEIGNEPDMFAFQGYRAASTDSPSIMGKYSWDPSAFLKEYDAYRIALQKAIPEAGFSGPGVGLYLDGVEWLPKFLTAEPQGLVFTSVHYYPMVRPDRMPKELPLIPASSPVYPTIAHMLSPRIGEWVMENGFAPQMRASRAQGLPFRVTELNSAAYGGQTGVSDVFASALWILDYSFRFLSLGADGIDVMTDLPTGGLYSAIQVENGVHVARPIYYGMLFFHQAAQGRLVPSESGGDAAGPNFSVYSTLGPDHTARVTLINKESALAVRARIQISGGHYESANILRLTAPALDAASGVEFGGAAVQADGSWQPKAGETIKAEAGTLIVTVPPGSAALLIAEPAKPAMK
jgi:hypothetical protein